MEHINYGRENEGWNILTMAEENEGWNILTMAEEMKDGTYKLWQRK